MGWEGTGSGRFSEARFYCRLIASHSNFPICLQFRERTVLSTDFLGDGLQ